MVSSSLLSFRHCLTESFEPAACEAICAKATGCACLEYTPDPETGGGRHRCKIYSGVTALKTFARHDAYVLSGNDAAEAIPALSQALNDEDDSVRVAAAYALETIEEISRSE